MSLFSNGSVNASFFFNNEMAMASSSSKNVLDIWTENVKAGDPLYVWPSVVILVLGVFLLIWIINCFFLKCCCGLFNNSISKARTETR